MAQSTPMRRALQIVKDCRQTLSSERAFYWNDSFEQQSYSRWAVNELLRRLRAQPDIPPLVTMEAFRDQLDEFSTLNKLSSYMFATAKDTVQWIIDLLIA